LERAGLTLEDITPKSVNIEELKKLRAQGYTVTQLAEHFGVTHPTITNRLGREGLTLADITPESVNISPMYHINLEEIKRLRAQGYTVRQIAEYFEVSTTPIYTTLERAGLTLEDITPESVNIEELKKLRAQGYTATQLAEHFGVSQPTITYRLKREGLTLKDITPKSVSVGSSGRPIVHGINLEEVKHLRAQGYTLEQIAEHFGVTKPTIINRLGREGLTLADITPGSVTIVRGRRPTTHDINLEEIKRLRAQGYTVAQLAEHFGVSTSPIYATLERAGLTMKDITPKSSMPRARPHTHFIDIEEIKRLRAEGYTLARLAEHFGTSQTTIKRNLMYKGLTLKDITPEEHRNVTVHDIDLDELKRLRAQGYTLARLAEHFGTSNSTVVSRLRREGLSITDIPKKNPLQMQGSTITKTVGFGVGAAATTALDYTLKNTTEISATKRHLISGGTTTAVGLGVYATTKREDALWSAYGSLFATVGCLIYDKVGK
jgi:DNA-binding CsgD family transcriptional regulator